MGKGYNSLEQFSMVMNMCLFAASLFDTHIQRIEKAAKTTVDMILKECRSLVKEPCSDLCGGKDITGENEESLSQEENDRNTQRVESENRVVENEVVSGEHKKTQCLNTWVSYDGSWPTRGFKSKHGFGCVIDLISGFLLDFEVISRFSQACARAASELGEDTREFHV